MYWEFNISQKGVHFFATAERSGQNMTPDRARDMYDVLVAKFPESEGYSITATQYTTKGITFFTRNQIERAI